MSKPSKTRFIRLIPAAAVMILIFIHSAMPADLSSAESGWLVDLLARLLHFAVSTDTLTLVVRKAAHFTEFLLLGMSLKWGLQSKHARPPQPREYLSAFLIGTAYAVTDEIHQLFVPGRSCELRDICIDMLGVLTGMLFIYIREAARSKKKNP